jgi:hypothetical protein
MVSVGPKYNKDVKELFTDKDYTKKQEDLEQKYREYQDMAEKRFDEFQDV